MPQANLNDMVRAERSHRDHMAKLASERRLQWVDGYRPLWREVAHQNLQAGRNGFGEIAVRCGEIGYFGGVESLNGRIVAKRAWKFGWRPPEEHVIAELVVRDEGQILDVNFLTSRHNMATVDKFTVRDAIPPLRAQIARFFA